MDSRDCYFETSWWSNSKAYIVGFILGDGCVSVQQDRLIITQKTTSRYILEDIQHALKLGGNISNRKDGCSDLYITSPKVVSDLIAMGIHPAKSLKARVPECIMEDFSLHAAFLRGLFDSDGGCTKAHNRPSYKSYFVSGSKELLEDVHSMLNEVDIISHILSSTRSFRLELSSHNTAKLAYYMYSHIDLGLHIDIKREKMLGHMNFVMDRDFEAHTGQKADIALFVSMLEYRSGKDAFLNELIFAIDENIAMSKLEKMLKGE